ncbi:MAG: hypothetical protein C5B54_01780 [Acidobacteria bacterium]|nr:MAG: hypothetical protein C5B54_01780 [Acidobacteriota bacterium]
MNTKVAFILFTLCMVVYICTDVGTVNSPDSEIVFRQAESLALTGSLIVHPLENWKHFGVARGKDDRLYPVFGIGEALALVPLIKVITYFDLPHHIDLTPFMAAKETSTILRFYGSLLNILITALSVVILFQILISLGLSRFISASVVLLYAFGTLAWSYANTYFSEPLAIFFLLLGFWLLILRESKRNLVLFFLSGLCVGLAASAHITAILFFPFYLMYAVLQIVFNDDHSKQKPVLSQIVVHCASLCIGFFVIAGLIGYYNFYRFGSIFETGRTIDPFGHLKFDYGKPVWPFTGIYGLLLSGYKSLFCFCPLMLFSIFCWPSLHQKRRSLSWTLILLCVFRLFFIASRSDWHGGASLGPRYLLMMISFMMIPIGFWLQQSKSKTSHIFFLVLSAVVVGQQLYFSLGDIFHFRVPQNMQLSAAYVDSSYLRWQGSPLFFLHEGEIGPFMLRVWMTQYSLGLWFALSVISGLAMIFIQHYLITSGRNQPATATFK